MSSIPALHCAAQRAAAPLHVTSVHSCHRKLCCTKLRRQHRIRGDVKARGVVPVAERAGWWLKHPQPNLIEAHGLPDVTAILEANSDRLVILDFFAPWCASCKGLYPKLSKMCEENPQIVIAKINFEENKELAKKLGVKVLPFFQAYHGSMGRVAAFSSSITKIQRLKDCIQLFGQPYCDLETHTGKLDVSKSLPEFEKLPHPDDASILKMDVDGNFDTEASIAAKEKQAQRLGQEAVDNTEAQPAA